MTHYAQLSEALEYAKGSGQKLVLRGSRVTLDELTDHYLAGDLDSFRQAHPDVSDYHVEQVAEIVADVLQDVPDEQRARRQLQRQAHWALLSEHASRLIEREADKLADTPTREELLALARQALDLVQPQADNVVVGKGHQSRDPREQPTCHEPSGSVPIGSRDALQQVAAEITDCSSRVRNAADQLQGDHPVHAAYARELATRLDELQVDLLPPQREG